MDTDFFNPHIYLLGGYEDAYYYESDGTGHGGGAYYDSNAAADFNSCTFTNNSIHGIMYEYGYEWRWPEDLFDPNDPNAWADPNYIYELYELYGRPYDYYSYYYYGNGAGICCDANNSVVLRGCTFTYNTIGNEYQQISRYYSSYTSDFGNGNGGALYCGPRSIITVDNCTFRDNSNGIKYDDSAYADRYYYYDPIEYVGGYGGAIFCGADSEIALSDTLVSRNEATYAGGGFYLDPNCLAVVDDSVIIGNEASQSGGGLYSDVNTVIDVNASAFVANMAVSGSGGAMCLRETDANIIRCPINDNTANRGGGLYWTGGNTTISDCTISGNSATGKHEAGGGFYCVGSDPMIQNCVIAENTAAAGFGGGGYVAGVNRAPTIKNCLITDNSAAYNGGGLYVDWGCTPAVTNSTFANNSASSGGGALYCTNNAVADVTDSIIWANTAETGGAQIGLGNAGSSADVSYSDVQGGYAGTGNIDADPCFVGEYYLQQADSPCVNAGSELASAHGFDQFTTSIDNILDSGQVDMGYHHRPNCVRLNAAALAGYGLVAPVRMCYINGTVVAITAVPERGYKVKQWTGTDDDSSTSSVNTVTMDSDITVTVEFEFAATRTLVVPGNYLELQSAIDAAVDGDVIILNKGVWPWGGFRISDKVIMVTGTNPDDPNVVAETVIDCEDYYQGGSWSWVDAGGFYFGPGSGSSILNGITIRGARGGYGAYDYYDPYYGYSSWSYGGGAITTTQGTSPRIANCVITEALIYGGDGGTIQASMEETPMAPASMLAPEVVQPSSIALSQIARSSAATAARARAAAATTRVSSESVTAAEAVGPELHTAAVSTVHHRVTRLSSAVPSTAARPSVETAVTPETPATVTSISVTAVTVAVGAALLNGTTGATANGTRTIITTITTTISGAPRRGPSLSKVSCGNTGVMQRRPGITAVRAAAFTLLLTVTRLSSTVPSATIPPTAVSTVSVVSTAAAGEKDPFIVMTYQASAAAPIVPPIPWPASRPAG
jgi:predicted outer membrane repeat protein